MSDSSRKQGVRRRDLVRGAAVGTVAAVGGAGLAACGDGTAGAVRWHREVDMVVLGSGTGLVGALAARHHGLETLVLEKQPSPGGNTALSGGVAWVPNNHLMQKEGISDPREGAIAYLRRNGQGQGEEHLIKAFVDKGPEMLRFVDEKTPLQLRISRILGKVSDYHPEWPGTVVRGRSVEPAVDGAFLLGGYLVQGLLAGAEQAGVEVMLETPAKRLLAQHMPDGTVEVLGVHAERNGEAFNVRARRGVLLATGGFEHDLELKRHFLRGPSPYTLGAKGNTGDGLRMAMAVGADLRNLNEVWSLTVYKREGELAAIGQGAVSLNAQIEKRNSGGIAVNRYGERFSNEGADYDSTWRSYLAGENWGDLAYRNLPAFQIYDNGVRRNATIAGRNAGQPLPDWVAQANTLAELARRLGIDEAGLVRTVESFNRYAREGQDPVFHRGESIYDRFGEESPAVTLGPVEEPPFYGAEVVPGDTGTCGGPRVNENAQVLNPFGQVIRRLYASGNCSGVGGPGAGYGGGGGTIGPAMTFAYIAGRHVAITEL